MRSYIRSATLAALTLTLASVANAQPGVGATLTPYAGYLVTGKWFDGPLGTSVTTSNSPMVGVQGAVPLTRGISLVGNVGYASGDLRIGLPVIGGVNVGTAKTWVYDAGLELGGLSGKPAGIAPFVGAGIGGMTNDIKNTLFSTRASNMAYTGSLGVDVGLTKGFSLRVQAKDYMGKFDSEEAVGYQVNNKLTHNWASSAGVRLGW
jgi:hypothetical protein